MPEQRSVTNASKAWLSGGWITRDSSLAFGLLRGRPAGVLKALQHAGIIFEESGQIRKDLDGGLTQMMFDAFDIPLLGLPVQAEQRKKPSQRLMTPLNAGRHCLAPLGQNQPPILLVI